MLLPMQLNQKLDRLKVNKKKFAVIKWSTPIILKSFDQNSTLVGGAFEKFGNYLLPRSFLRRHDTYHNTYQNDTQLNSLNVKK
jgi:hypothetical protein